MLDKKALFVFNPYAGKGKIKNNLVMILDQLTKAGYEVVAYPTQKAGDAREKVLELEEGYDRIVCSGGDGTLDEVVSGMMQREKKIPIAYIPAGSTNDFAGSLQIPKDMKKSAAIAAGGVPYACDIGNFNGETFVYVAAFGAFTEVSYATSQDFKNALGHAAYMLSGIEALTKIKSFPMRARVDGEIIEGEFIYGMVTNSVSVGGFKNITGKNVNLSDGSFEVTLIRKPKSPADLAVVVSSLLSGNAKSESILFRKAAKVEFHFKQEVPWTRDGEYGGEHKNVLICNENRALEIIVPSDRKEK